DSSAAPVADPSQSLLAQFHYLSTVSGGGYIGSWLSAWLTRADFAAVWAGLVRRSLGPDLEAPPISWLRSYSNYLTPRRSFLSADRLSTGPLYLGNLLLNWLVIVPYVCAGILLLRILFWVLVNFTVALRSAAKPDAAKPLAAEFYNWSISIFFAACGVFCLL